MGKVKDSLHGRKFVNAADSACHVGRNFSPILHQFWKKGPRLQNRRTDLASVGSIFKYVAAAQGKFDDDRNLVLLGLA